METVQLVIADASYASALRDLLEGGTRQVRNVESPDPGQDGVIVVDSNALDRLALPLATPERVVLITRNDSKQLAKAWNAGIRSVVFSEDPLSTAVLAIMAAGLRVSKPESRCPGLRSTQGAGCAAASVGHRSPDGDLRHAPGRCKKEGLK